MKALAPLLATPSVLYVVRALLEAGEVGRVCVVGPEAVGETLGELCLWQAERTSALTNTLAGLERLEARPEDRVLVCGTDVPMIVPGAIDDFLQRSSGDADICMPIIGREPFVRTFPGNLGIYVRLAEGAFTAGSQVLIRARALLDNLALVESLYRRRKSQLGMAAALGAPLIWRLVSGRLTVPEVEARLSLLTGCRCRAVPDCRPELAFDIDTLLDLRYAERWLAAREGKP